MSAANPATIWEGQKVLVPVLPGTGNLITETQQVLSQNQQIFTLGLFQYLPGSGTVLVYINGVLQQAGVDYVETSATTITMVVGLNLGDKVAFVGYAISNLNVFVQTFTQSAIPYPSGSASAKFSQTINPKDSPWNAKFDGVTDDTIPINACFAFATANYLGVSLEGCQTVRTSNTLVYGTQNVVGGNSQAPLFLKGSGYTCTIVADLYHADGITPFTEPVIKAWSIAGNHWDSFSIRGNGTHFIVVDTDWKLGVGPSAQNQFRNIRVSGAKQYGTTWSCKNNNDTIFDKVLCSAFDPNGVCFDAVASGGLFYMYNCIWDNGYARLGMQNGSIVNCWGMGIELAAQCTNYITIIGGYIYWNTVRQCCMWSQSFASFQSARAITAIATQWIGGGANPSAGFFDLNLLSTFSNHGCQWIADVPLQMFAPNCRKDSFAAARVKFIGGSYSDLAITLNRPAGFITEYSGFIKDNAGIEVPNFESRDYLSGGGTGGIGAGTWYTLFPAGTITDGGTYILQFSWNHNGGGAPFVFTAAAIVSTPPLTAFAGQVSDPIPGNAITYAGNFYGLVISFRAITGTNVPAGFQWQSNLALTASGTWTWKLIKMAEAT